MSRNWTESSKERQRQAINSSKPWESSTGPKSKDGKSRSSRNADKGKSDLRLLQKMISKIHKERLELLRCLNKTYNIRINI